MCNQIRLPRLSGLDHGLDHSPFQLKPVQGTPTASGPQAALPVCSVAADLLQLGCSDITEVGDQLAKESGSSPLGNGKGRLCHVGGGNVLTCHFEKFHFINLDFLKIVKLV